MLKEKMQDMLNKQIKNELDSAYLYLSMSAYFESSNLKGFAKWMRVQAKEEDVHAMKFFDYIHEVGSEVELLSLDKPEKTWKSPLAIFEAAYQHEQKVTAMIHHLVKLSNELSDYPTLSFLQWFVNEQVEEESSALEIVQKLKMIGENKPALLMLDHELGKRGG